MLPDECIDLVNHLLCTQSAPPCNSETGQLMLFCEEDCRLYEQLRERGICSEIGALLANIAEVTVSPIFDALVEFYFNLNCSDPTTYYQINLTHPDTHLCMGMFSPLIEGM